MKKKQLLIPLWDRHLHLLMGGDWNDILKFAKSRSFSHEATDEIIKDQIRPEDRGACYWCHDQGEGILWFPNKKPDSFMHEFIHLIDFLSIYIGSEGEFEGRAYTGDWLEKTIPEELKKM